MGKLPNAFAGCHPTGLLTFQYWGQEECQTNLPPFLKGIIETSVVTSPLTGWEFVPELLYFPTYLSVCRFRQAVHPADSFV
jgi:hypothetical protein